MPLRKHARTLAIVRLLRSSNVAQHARGRGPLPHQQQPDAIRLAYFNAIMSLVRQQLLHGHNIRAEVLHLLIQERQAEQHAPLKLDASDRGRRAHEIARKAGKAAAEAYRPREVYDLAEKFGKRTGDFNREQLDKQVRHALGVSFDTIEKPTQDLIPDFARSNVELISTVSDRYFDRLADSVQDAFESGEHPETLADRLVELDDIAESDARRIARDQIGRLNAEFNHVRQESMGVTSYIWRTMRDQRVRDNHDDLDGEQFDWDDPPMGGGTDKEEEGHPGDGIQCRCYAEPDLQPILDDLDMDQEEAEAQ